MRGWLAVAASGCAVAACSLGALDCFSGGAADAADGGDATVDVATNIDGGDPVDANAPDGDAGAKRFCESLAQPARACLDFDDAKLPLGFSKEENQGGTATFDSAGKDGTGGLASTAPPSATSATSACVLTTLVGPRKDSDR